MEKFTKVTTKKRKRSEDLEEKKKVKKPKKGEITWESIQESFPKKITVAQLKKCVWRRNWTRAEEKLIC